MDHTRRILHETGFYLRNEICASGCAALYFVHNVFGGIPAA